MVRHRILVVDDNKDGADSLAMTLKPMGHDVRTAYDGLEGVEVAETFCPDVVLLDLSMPGSTALRPPAAFVHNRGAKPWYSLP